MPNLLGRSTASIAISVLVPLFCTELSGSFPSASGMSRSTEGTQQEPSGAIEGQVVDDLTSEPLGGVRVAVWRGTRRQETTTGADGRFRFQALSPGEVTLSFEREGYSAINPFSPDPMPGVKVNPGQTTTVPAVRMLRESRICGIVQDRSSRRGLGGFSLLAFQWEYTELGRALIPRAQTTSDERTGSYCLVGLRAGEYLLEVSPPLQERIGRGQPSQESPLLGYRRLYYPSSADPALAVPVAVAPGEHRTGVDFSLSSTPLCSIRGIVRLAAQAGTSAPQITLVLLESASRFARVIARGRLDGPGPFEIRGLSSGQWTLAAWTSQAAVPRLFAATEFFVTERDIDGVELLLAPGERLQGHVVFPQEERAQPLPRPLAVWLRSADRLEFQDERNSSAVDEQGRFEFSSVLPGHYWLEVQGLPPGFFVRQIRFAGHDADEGRISVVPGVLDRNLTVVLSARTGAISGQVVGKNGAPVGQAVIIVVPNPLARDRPPRPDRVQTTAAYENGMFSFPYLAPGKYLLFAIASLPRNRQYDPAFLHAHRRFAAELEVNPGQTQMVQLTLADPLGR